MKAETYQTWIPWCDAWGKMGLNNLRMWLESLNQLALQLRNQKYELDSWPLIYRVSKSTSESLKKAYRVQSYPQLSLFVRPNDSSVSSSVFGDVTS